MNNEASHMRIKLNKEALDILMPICREHKTNPNHLLIMLLSDKDFKEYAKKVINK